MQKLIHESDIILLLLSLGVLTNFGDFLTQLDFYITTIPF
jgi:hypothetical protein